MKGKRIAGIILLALGIGCYFFSSYISDEVAQGRGKIAKAQKGVDEANSLFGKNRYTKDAGSIATGSVQKKIDAGRRDADTYQTVANWLYGIGIVVFVAGAGLIVYTFVKKR